MQKAVSIGLLALLLCYSLGHALIYWSVVGQEQRDLSASLTMFWTVDSMVEFHLPLHNQPPGTEFTQENVPGFDYRGKSYEVIRMDVRRDTLFIVGYENRKHSVWTDDLLAFVKKEITGSSDTQRKTNQLLKLLLKEYLPADRPSVREPVVLLCSTTGYGQSPPLQLRALPVHSPPPEAGSRLAA